MLVREQKLLPFLLLGFDTDNASVFMNKMVRDYCAEAGVKFTCCRPCRKLASMQQRRQPLYLNSCIEVRDSWVVPGATTL